MRGDRHRAERRRRYILEAAAEGSDCGANLVSEDDGAGCHAGSPCLRVTRIYSYVDALTDLSRPAGTGLKNRKPRPAKRVQIYYALGALRNRERLSMSDSAD